MPKQEQQHSRRPDQREPGPRHRAAATTTRPLKLTTDYPAARRRPAPQAAQRPRARARRSRPAAVDHHLEHGVDVVRAVEHASVQIQAPHVVP